MYWGKKLKAAKVRASLLDEEVKVDCFEIKKTPPKKRLSRIFAGSCEIAYLKRGGEKNIRYMLPVLRALPFDWEAPNVAERWARNHPPEWACGYMLQFARVSPDFRCSFCVENERIVNE